MNAKIYVQRIVVMDEEPARVVVRPERGALASAPPTTPPTSPPYHPDRLTGLALGAMEILLRDVRMDERARMGVVMGTVAGCLEVDREFDRSRRENARYASPAAFSRTLPSTVLAELALYIKLTGPSVALSNGDATFAFAVWRAARWVEAFDLPCCAAVYADHLGRGLRNPYTGEAIAAAEGSCFVQMWLLSRKTGGEELRLGEVSLTRFAGGTHAIG